MLKELREITTAAGRLAKELRPAARIAKIKGRGDYLTEADLQTQEKLIDGLAEYFPGIPVVAEEDLPHIQNAALSRDCFVIDPIDGTAGYVAGKAERWGVLLAYLKDQRPQAAIIYLPEIETTIEAELGGGTLLNGRQVTFSDTQGGIAENFCTVELGPWLKDESRYFQILHKICASSIGVTAFCGAAWGGYELLRGGSSLYLNYSGSRIWDMAAPALAVAEAGGCAIALSGESLQWNQLSLTGILAANKTIAAEVVDIIGAFQRSS